MKRTSLILLIVGLAFAACDKVDASSDGTYTDRSSGNGSSSWVDPNQRVYVEKYTGASCTYCPLADETLDAAHHRFGDRLVVISVNDCFTGQGRPHEGQPDFRNECGRQWEEWAIGTASGIPAALVGRDRTKKYQSAMANIVPAIDEALRQSATLAIDLSAQRGADSIAIAVSLRFLADIAAPLTLTLALTEDSLVYMQSNRSVVDTFYCHNHILRDVATPVWGSDIEASGRSGEQRSATFAYRAPSTLSPTPVLDNCHIVALVSEKESRRVVAVAECPIR